jgi:hypothetical protein
MFDCCGDRQWDHRAWRGAGIRHGRNRGRDDLAAAGRIRELEGRNEALENAIGEIRDAAYEPDTTLATLKRHIAPNPCDRAQR